MATQTSRLRTASVVFLLVILCFVKAADAQSTFGTFTGTVTDPSGAVVPGATITVTNIRTQAARTTVTAGDGTYLVTNVDAGTYQVTMSLSGLADAVQQAILLARQSARVDGRLQLAGASEQVLVSATSPVIETSSARIDNSRSGDDINKLALNFRATSSTSPIVVATLAPASSRTGAAPSQWPALCPS